jgi:hypothetical protein
MRFETFPVPDPHLEEMKELKKAHATERRTSDVGSVALAGVEGFESRIGGLGPLEILHGLRRFFLNMTGAKIDIHERIELGKTTYEGIPETKVHLLRRRINGFLAQLSWADVEGGVPLKIHPPEYAIDCVEAILTTFRALRKLKKMAAYCDTIPFSEDLDLSSPMRVRPRETIISCALDKFPKLASEGRRMGGPGRRRTGAVKESDDLTYEDIMVTAFLLPHVIRPDLVKDFLRTEVEVSQKVTQGPADPGSQAVPADAG